MLGVFYLLLAMGKIGIGITVHNRNETAKITIDKINEFAPIGAKIVIVDDASEITFAGSDYRFEKQAGIARTKNKCLELLDDCDHIFLFDDDCYPKDKDWHLPYINSKYNHLMYIFGNFSNGKPNGNRRQKEIEDAVIYENPCGCMIYYKKICIDTVGGMDVGYGVWGFEHPDHSVRIYNAGLTPFKFMDVKDSDKLFFSHDKEQTIQRSVSGPIRAKHISRNEPKYKALGNSSHYIPYKVANNLILTCYFTSVVDPQRGKKWEHNDNDLAVLKNSIPEGIKFECLTKANHNNPYLARWIAYRDYLNIHPEIDNVFMVDATDVEVKVNPFDYIDPKSIYCGDEESDLKNIWLKKHHYSDKTKELFDMDYKLLNAGIVGGSRKIVLSFLDIMRDYISKGNCGMTDMAIFNLTLRKYFNYALVHGRRVNTAFKAFDKVNRSGSWFKHK